MASNDVRLTVGKVSKVLLWIVYAWVVINIVLLFLAFVLRLFGASTDAGFTQWVYRSVERSMAPFRGIFEPIPLNGQSVLDTSLLFAIIIYGLAALLLRAAIDWTAGLIEGRQRRLQQQASSAASAASAAALYPPTVPGAPPTGSPYDDPAGA